MSNSYNHDVQLGGKFKLQAVQKDTGEARDLTDWFDNLVLDSGLARMATGAWITGISVGSGSSEPLVGQTGLDSFIARTTHVYSWTQGRNVSVEPYYYWSRATYRFSPGQAAGNLAEIGAGWGDNNLWNRTLIKDLNGDPTTITVFPSEYLDVSFELRIYPNTTDVTKTITYQESTTDGLVDVSEHTVTIRPNMTYDIPMLTPYGYSTSFPISFTSYSNNPSGATRIYSGQLGTVVTEPTTYIGYSNTVTQTRDATDKEITGYVVHNIDNSVGSHRSVVIETSIGCFKFEYDPPIQKTNTMELTHNFSLTWGRYVT